MDKRFMVFGILVAMLLSSASANALVGSIRPPRMILHGNATGQVSASVDVINPNEVPMNVTTGIFGDIKNLTALSESRMILGPNETREINFNVSLPREGQYIGDIVFVFTTLGNETQGAALSSTIIIFAEGATETPSGDEAGSEDNAGPGITGNVALVSALPWALAAMIMVILASFLLYNRRGTSWSR
jgi:hypothetical protein